MIRTEAEATESRRQLDLRERAKNAQRAALLERGLPPEHVELAMLPIEAFLAECQDEIEWYRSAVTGQVAPVGSVAAIGRILIGLRIARGVTQAELAERLGVSAAQVSRDERNDYHAITTDRAQRILDAMGASVTISLSLSLPEPTDSIFRDLQPAV